MQSCRGGPALNHWLLSAAVPVPVLEPGHIPFIWALAPRCLLRGPHQLSREGTSLPRPICRSGGVVRALCPSPPAWDVVWTLTGREVCSSRVCPSLWTRQLSPPSATQANHGSGLSCPPPVPPSPPLSWLAEGCREPMGAAYHGLCLGPHVVPLQKHAEDYGLKPVKHSGHKCQVSC